MLHIIILLELKSVWLYKNLIIKIFYSRIFQYKSRNFKLTHQAQANWWSLFSCSTLALQRVFIFVTDGRTDTMCEKNWFLNPQEILLVPTMLNFNTDRIWTFSQSGTRGDPLIYLASSRIKTGVIWRSEHQKKSLFSILCLSIAMKFLKFYAGGQKKC